MEHYRNVDKAFRNAFEYKVFGEDDPWMYMYSDAKFDYFKHSWTRRTLEVPFSEENPFKFPDRDKMEIMPGVGPNY